MAAGAEQPQLACHCGGWWSSGLYDPHVATDERLHSALALRSTRHHHDTPAESASAEYNKLQCTDGERVLSVDVDAFNSCETDRQMSECVRTESVCAE